MPFRKVVREGKIQLVVSGADQERKRPRPSALGAPSKEETLARQRSRANWLKAGDRRTGFFQARAATRKSINRIHSLQTVDGEICETKEEIHAEVQQFYTSLYTAQEYTDVEVVLHHVPHKIT